MRTKRNTWMAAIVGASFMITSAVLAQAASSDSGQGYPSRPVRLVAGFPPGGTIDGLARTIAGQVENQLGRNIVVDNRAGANGIIAADIVSRAPADGHTMLFSPPALIINQIIGKPPYNVLRDFIPVANTALGEGSFIVVHPAVPVRSVQELITLARTKPLTYGTPGIGNTQHLATEMFSRQAGTKLVHVPYKGIAPAVTAVVSGEVSVLFGPPAIIVPHIQAGRLRVIGFTGEKRWSLMPEVPTVAESGLPGFSTSGAWQGIFVPARTPMAIVARLHREIATAIQVPKVRDFIRAAGYEPDGSGTADFRKRIEADLKRYGDIARAVGIMAK